MRNMYFHVFFQYFLFKLSIFVFINNIMLKIFIETKYIHSWLAKK